MQRAQHAKAMSAINKELEADQDAQAQRQFWRNFSQQMSTQYGISMDPLTWKETMRSPGEDGKVARQYLRAVAARAPLGETAGESAVITSMGSARFSNPEQAGVARWLKDQEAAYISANPSVGYAKMPLEQRAEMLQGELETKIVRGARKGTLLIEPGSIYAAPSYDNLSAFSDGLDEFTLWEAGLKDLPQSSPIKPDDVVTVAMAALQGGTYGKLNEGAIERAADDINLLYRKVNQYNAEVRGLSRVFNFPALVNNHKVRLQSVDDPVDMANRASVARALIVNVRKSMSPTFKTRFTKHGIERD